MATTAAIWYCIDQNEPSSPFLLELDCPQVPTAQELEKALIAHVRKLYQDEIAEYAEEEGIAPENVGVRVRQETDYGDLAVECQWQSSIFLFVGLPKQLEDLKKEFKSRDWPQDDWGS